MMLTRHVEVAQSLGSKKPEAATAASGLGADNQRLLDDIYGRRALEATAVAQLSIEVIAPAFRSA